jgi:hypothetical protein
MASLTEYVNRIRSDRGLSERIPYFDPLDGGVMAKALFLLEAPGPKAVMTGFISRNNPDPSARNFLHLLAEAGIERRDSILWNIVPWYLGDGNRIRGAKIGDITEGAFYLPKLFELLPCIRLVVLVGRKAQRAKRVVSMPSGVEVRETLHPSNQVVTCWPEKRRQIEKDLRGIAKHLAVSG